MLTLTRSYPRCHVRCIVGGLARQTAQFRALEKLKRDLLQNFKVPVTPPVPHGMNCMPTRFPQ